MFSSEIVATVYARRNTATANTKRATSPINISNNVKLLGILHNVRLRFTLVSALGYYILSSRITTVTGYCTDILLSWN